MDIKVDYREDVAVISVIGKVNINSSKLIETVGSLIDAGTHKIIVDMEDVDFIDYNGLSVLAIAYKSAMNHNCAMKLCGLSDNMRQLLRIVKLDDVFGVYKDVDGALSSFKKPGSSRAAMPLQDQPLRRRFKRLMMDIPINFRIDRRSFHGPGAEFQDGRVANISGSGIFIRTINILPPGTKVEIELFLEGRDKPISLNGFILWVADANIQPDFYPGIGVALTDISPRTQKSLIDFIDKNISRRSI